MAEKVPMHPRNRLSRPIFHVTNSGLRWEEKRDVTTGAILTAGVKFQEQCPSISDNRGQISKMTVSEQDIAVRNVLCNSFDCSRNIVRAI